MMRVLRLGLLFVSVGLVAIAIVRFVSGSGAVPATLPELPEVVLASVDAAVAGQIEQARQKVEMSPNDPVAVGRLGMLYEIYQYPAASRACYARAAVLSPRDFRWLYLLGRAEQMLGDPAAAVTAFETALENKRDYAPLHVKLGEAYLELGEDAKARAAFGSALDARASSVSARLGLGKILASQGDHEAAISQFRKALQMGPGYQATHYALALSVRALGRSEEAMRQFELAKHGDRSNPDPDPLLAAMYAMQIGVDADYRKAKALFKSGSFTDAEQLLLSVIQREPDHYGAHGVLGATLRRLNRNTEALEHFERAIELNPRNLDFLRPASLLLYGAGRFEEAESHLRSVLALGGDHADDHHVLGGVLYRLGRFEEAALSFGLALERNPGHERARQALVRSLEKSAAGAASDTEAIAHLRRLTEIDPLDFKGWMLLGERLNSMDDAEGAVEAFEAALAIRPGSMEALRRRDAMLAQVGR